jgi:DNA polymerase-3 subunit delta'
MLGLPLARLLGQPEVSRFLRRVVGSGRYGNAYLFEGPAGIGKGTAALAFARAALCERVPGAAPAPAPPAEDAMSLFGATPAPPPPPAAGDDACGACPSCRKAAQLGHPDLHFVFPVWGEESKLEKELLPAVLGGLREDPFFVFEYEKAASIRVSQTRDLQRELAYHPYEASRRVVVIRDCDRMREDQYSTLLKSIEEPGAATVWVLTTSRPHRVPATIRSRCQRVRFAPLPESVITAVLTGEAAVPGDDAVMLAALANGSLARALAGRGRAVTAERDKAFALLVPALAGRPEQLWTAIQGYMNFGRTGRETLRRTLEHHQLWLRDVLRLRHGADREALVNRDRIAELAPLAERLDAHEVRRRLAVLEEAIRAIDGNVSPDLTLFSTLARVAGSRVGEGAWPPHPAARWTD